MANMKNCIYLGHVAVFYIPADKLDAAEYYQNGKSPRDLLHEFLTENYNAYTLETSNIQGFWRKDVKALMFHDVNVRYECSFAGGQEAVEHFTSFLSELCALLKEEYIYMTAGYKSWLIPAKQDF